MDSFFDHLFESDFMPHGHCYFWKPDILWTHAISDSIIATSYFVIPFVLLYIFRKRSNIRYVWMFVLFAVFIAGCGITHVFDVITIWNPLYRFDSLFRIITALASIGTAIVLVKVTPSILAIPTAEEWQKLNEELKAQIVQLEEKDRIIEAFQEFEHLTETLPQLVFTYHANGKAHFYNRKWYQYTGLGFEQDLFEMMQQVVEPSLLTHWLTLWEESIKTGQPFEAELSIQRYDGLYYWHLVRATPVKLSHPDQRWVCTFTDIHDQKMRSQELEEKNRELSIINDDLDNFIYTASHDLKAPIANLEGLATMLAKQLEGRLNDTERQVISLMDISIARFRGTLHDLTEIVRAQKETNEPLSIIRFEEMLMDVRIDLSYHIEASKAIIEADLSVEEVRYARKNLKSIIYNLISNALKYRSPNRLPLIQIRTDRQGSRTLLTVNDNGLGMTPEQLKKLFTMFKRFHPQVEGSGIGLFIVKRIIENNGGQIEVESEVNQGTTFRVTL